MCLALYLGSNSLPHRIHRLGIMGSSFIAQYNLKYPLNICSVGIDILPLLVYTYCGGGIMSKLTETQQNELNYCVREYDKLTAAIDTLKGYVIIHRVNIACILEKANTTVGYADGRRITRDKYGDTAIEGSPRLSIKREYGNTLHESINKIEVTQLSCQRCEHTWIPRHENPPRHCPKCKSPYWDKPRNFTKPRITFSQRLFQEIFGWRFIEPYKLKDNVQEGIDSVKSTIETRIWRVLELRFGFDGEPQTLQDIANIYQVTRERIRQIQQKGLRLLRHPSRSRILRDYIQEDSWDSKP